jgi:WD40 repeat protein
MRPTLPAFLALAPCLVVAVAPADPAADVDRLIRRLGDDDFGAREEATARLAELGEAALPALKKAAKESPNAEVKRRAVLLVARIEREARGELLTIRGPTPGYWVNRVAFSADGKRAIAAGGGVIWYDLERGTEVNRVLERQFARPGLALSPDGRTFATGHQTENDVRLGDAASGKDVGTCRGHTAGVWAVAFSPDGKRLVSGSDDRTVRVWEVGTGKELVRIDHGRYQARAAAFAPDGKTVASGAAGGDGRRPIVIWDAGTGKEVKRLAGHGDDVTAVLFLPDGKRLLSAGRDGLLVLWDVESGRELKRMVHGPGVIYAAALSPDGKRALTAGFSDKTVRLWDLEKGEEVRKFEGHAGAVLGVAFSPDGKRALSSDSQDTVKLWKLPE